MELELRWGQQERQVLTGACDAGAKCRLQDGLSGLVNIVVLCAWLVYEVSKQLRLPTLTQGARCAILE